MTTIVSFDVSSTTIGFGVLETDGYKINYIKSGYYKPIHSGSIIEDLIETRKEISKIINDSKPDIICIEDIIKFMKGKSTADTIIKLTSFNRMICLLAYDYLNEYPKLFNVLSIRHGLKENKILPKKEDMPALVSKHLGITFPYEYNKKGKSKVENEDVADGIAVGLYYAFVLTGKCKLPKIKKPKSEKKLKKK